MPAYTATAIIHVDSVQPKLVFDTAEPDIDLGIFQRTQVALLKDAVV